MGANIFKKINVLSKNCRQTAYYDNKRKTPVDEHAVLLESKAGKDLAGNIFYLLKQLTSGAYNDFTCYLVVRKSSFDAISSILKKYGMSDVRFVYMNSPAYYNALATAKYLFNDTTFPAWFYKRPEQVYLNTWHGTPLKHMGSDVKDRIYAIGNVQNNFTCADYLLYPNPYMMNIMASAYYLDNLYQGRYLCEGYPRNSVFFNSERGRQVKEMLSLSGKQVIVYMPTWRGVLTKMETAQQLNDLKAYFYILDRQLKDNQIFYVKFHLFLSKSISFEDFDHIKPFPEGIETYDFINCADVLVTDYSSIFFDFANTRRKIILFAYDKDSYMKDRGLYIPFDSLPFPQAATVEDLVKAINSPELPDYSGFIQKYCTYDRPDAADRILRHVLRGEKACLEVSPRSNGLENIVFYCSNLGRNGITTSLINLLSLLDNKHANYYVTFTQEQFAKIPLRLTTVPEGVGFLPVSGALTNRTLLERICYVLYIKFNIDNKFILKYINRQAAREYNKRFEGVKIDKYIHFTGYAPEITLLFQQSPAKKAIFAHNDMYAEYKEKHNFHMPILKHAYAEYDRIAAVSEATRQSLAKILPDLSKVAIVENSHYDEGVRLKSEMPLVFDETTAINISQELFKSILDSDALKFITIGRFSTEKGHKKLITAFEQFHKNHPESVLIIIGGYGTQHAATLRFAGKQKCASDIVIIKAISNPFPILKRCNLFLLPSDREPLGLVLLEADTLGVPIVATDIPGSGDFLKRYNGYLVENSAKGLEAGMEAYLRGEVKPLNISFDGYNRSIIEAFEHLFD